jgi:hypothetical protein
MFEYVHKAGLLPHEMARLLKLNRITVSLWMNGHSKPHRILTKQVEELLDRVRQAVEDGHLPLSVDIKRKDRVKIIDELLGTKTTDIERTS